MFDKRYFNGVESSLIYQDFLIQAEINRQKVN